jgi:hypothetical protein
LTKPEPVDALRWTDDLALACASRDNLIEEVASCAVLDLYDPNIRIEPQLACETLLDLDFRCWRLGQAPAEQPIRRSRCLEGALRRRATAHS